MPRALPTLAALLLAVAPVTATAEIVAAFPFELINTSLEPTRPDETSRLHQLDAQLRDALQARGDQLADLAPVQDALEKIASLRACNGCELDLAGDVGAGLAMLGWVQKVSNLILNINLQTREVATGRLVAGGSVDIRGNTDQSWERGLRALLRHALPAPSR